MNLPNLEHYIEEITSQFKDSVRSIKIDELCELVAKTDTFLQKYMCLNRELCMDISIFIDQVQLSLDGVFSNTNQLHLRNCSSGGSVDSQFMRTTDTQDDFCLDSLSPVTNTRVTSENMEVTKL